MPQYRHKVKKEKEEPQERGTMVFVHGKGMDALSEALRRFRKKVEAAQIMEDGHKSSYYIKPSKRKREKRFANARQAKAEARMRRKKASENKITQGR